MKRAVLLLFVLFLTHPLFGFEPPALEKAAAQRIMESMAWTEVTIIAIRQGVDAKGLAAPVCATVIGLGKCEGRHRSIMQTFHFDRDLDWHVLEVSEKSARVWNKDGYREIKPWATW